jgi:hypothetical protein
MKMLQKRLRKSYEMDTTVDKTLLRPPSPPQKKKKIHNRNITKKKQNAGAVSHLLAQTWLQNEPMINVTQKRATLHGTNNANKIDPDDLGKHKQIHSAID